MDRVHIRLLQSKRVRGHFYPKGTVLELPIRDGRGLVGRGFAEWYPITKPMPSEPAHEPRKPDVKPWTKEQWVDYLQHARAQKDFLGARARAQDALGVDARSWSDLESAIMATFEDDGQ